MSMEMMLVMFPCPPCYLRFSPHYPKSFPPASWALLAAIAIVTAGVVVANAVVAVVVLGTE